MGDTLVVLLQKSLGFSHVENTIASFHWVTSAQPSSAQVAQILHIHFLCHFAYAHCFCLFYFLSRRRLLLATLGISSCQVLPSSGGVSTHRLFHLAAPLTPGAAACSLWLGPLARSLRSSPSSGISLLLDQLSVRHLQSPLPLPSGCTLGSIPGTPEHAA